VELHAVVAGSAGPPKGGFPLRLAPIRPASVRAYRSQSGRGQVPIGSNVHGL
jgi:hypothetical protein